MPKAKEAAKRALEIDDTLPEAHSSLATVNWWYDWDWLAAERELRRAIELNPNYASGHEQYGRYLVSMGRFDEGIEENKRGVQLDPLSLRANANLGQSLYFSRRYAQAIEQLRKAIDMDPNFWVAHSDLGLAYEQKGQFPEAIAELQKAVLLEGAIPAPTALLGRAYAVSGKRAEAQKVLDELKERSKRSYVPPYNIAIIYTGLGEKDQALAWLEKAYAERSFYLTLLKVDPDLDSLRSDPRFQDLARRVGLPP